MYARFQSHIKPTRPPWCCVFNTHYRRLIFVFRFIIIYIILFSEMKVIILVITFTIQSVLLIPLNSNLYCTLYLNISNFLWKTDTHASKLTLNEKFIKNCFRRKLRKQLQKHPHIHRLILHGKGYFYFFFFFSYSNNEVIRELFF